MKILWITTTLDIGGAETMLYKLAKHLCSHFILEVISLKRVGYVGKQLSMLKIPVHSLNLSKTFSNFKNIASFIQIVKKFRPHLIQGWMYHGNLAGILAQHSLSFSSPLLWGIRQSLSRKYDKWLTQWLIQLGASYSFFPDKIIYNAYTSARDHEAIGYSPNKRVVIPNGFDTHLFSPRPSAKKEICRKFQLPKNAFIIGYIARYHPVKGHEIFLKAASYLITKYSHIYFLLVGKGNDSNNPELMEWIHNWKLMSHVRLCGEQKNIAQITAALDIATSSSYSEGFSNSLGEAMSCGIPCVATSVGDSPHLLGNTGILVPSGNPCALQNAWASLIEMETKERQCLGIAARERILEHYSLEKIAKKYSNLYLQIYEKYKNMT